MKESKPMVPFQSLFKTIQTIKTIARYLVKGAILLQRPELMHMFRAGQSAIEQYMNHDDW